MAKPFELWTAPGDRDIVRGRVSDAWASEIARDVNLAHAVFVLEIVLGNGARRRACPGGDWWEIEPAVRSVNELGQGRAAAPVLLVAPSVTNSYAIDSTASGARTVSGSMPGWFVQPMEQLRYGLPLAGFGEVSMLVDGMAWEDRRVILRGDMSSVAFGGSRPNQATKWGTRAVEEHEPFRFRLQDPRASGDAVFPPASWVVDTNTFSDPHASAIGKPYTIVFGDGRVQCLRIESAAIGPEFFVAVGANIDVRNVWLNDEINTAWNFTTDVDANGVTFTKITWNVAPTLEDSATLFAEFVIIDPALSPPPDLPAPEILDVVRDALLTYHPAGADIVNEQLFADAEARLGAGRRCKAIVNVQGSLIQWIETDLLDDFPMIVMSWQGGRYGPIVTDFRAPPVKNLVCGSTGAYWRSAEISETPKFEVFNQVLVRFDFDAFLDNFTGTVEVGPSNSPLAAASENAIGLRSKLIEGFHIADRETALYIAEWVMDHRSLPTLSTAYPGPASLFWELRLGDTVLLADLDPGWDAPGLGRGALEERSVTATVESLALQRARCDVGLRIWNNPLRGLPWPDPDDEGDAIVILVNNAGDCMENDGGDIIEKG